MSQSIDVGSVLGGRYKVTSSIVESHDGDLVLDGVDQILNRPVSILVSAPHNAEQLAQSAREVATGERHVGIQVLDLGTSHGATYLITNHAQAADLLDLIVAQDEPYVEPFFTESLGSEIFGEARSREPETYDGLYDHGQHDYIQYSDAEPESRAPSRPEPPVEQRPAPARPVPPPPAAPPRSSQPEPERPQPAQPSAQSATAGPAATQPQTTQRQPPQREAPQREAAQRGPGAGTAGAAAAAAAAAAVAAAGSKHPAPTPPKVTPWPGGPEQRAPRPTEPEPTQAVKATPAAAAPGDPSAPARGTAFPPQARDSSWSSGSGSFFDRDDELEEDDESTRPKSVPWLVGGILAVVLIAALIFAFTTLGSVFQPQAGGTKSADNGPSATSSGSPSSGQTQAPAPAVAPVIESVTRLNPNELTFASQFDAKLPATYDGNPASYWSDMEFAREDWGGFAKSVALSVKLKDVSDIKQVELDQLGATGGSVSVYTNAAPDLAGATLAGTSSFNGPQLVFQLPTAVKAQYVIIQINALPKLANFKVYPYGLRLAEIKAQ